MGGGEIHNHIRGVSDSFERILLGVKKFREQCAIFNYKPQINFVCTINPMNYRNLQELCTVVKENNIDLLEFGFLWFISKSISDKHNRIYENMYPVSPSCYNDFMNTKEMDIDFLWEELTKIKENKSINVLVPEGFNKKKLEILYKTDKFINENARCMASWFSMQILANGNVVVFSRCHSQSIGNINENNILDIWNGTEMKRWRSLIKKHKNMPMCAKCCLLY